MSENLQKLLAEDFGKKTIDKQDIPSIITSNLNPNFDIRPYQRKAFQYFLTYWNEDFEGKPATNHHLLFHMATGSGKTLMMAGLMLYLYEQGYRNFLFFVNSANIIEKTRQNFLEKLASKYLFAQNPKFKDSPLTIRAVENFQSVSKNELNICFSTIQGLHSNLNSARENGITYDDFEDKKIVLISDEAHHLNASTKKGQKLSQDELFESVSWENTVQRIFQANPENLLLEFTATIDFADKELSQKYLPKMIYDYPLREFRLDKYSKEIQIIEADLPPFERALNAILLSQYRRRLFEKFGLSKKPVILFKSKTVKESEAFYDEFKARMSALNVTDFQALNNTASPQIQAALSFFIIEGLQNLVQQTKGDFSESNLIITNSLDKDKSIQIKVNTLEDSDNEIRAVFAVDKLNEGWDVLNLFDIVRLYDTRDSKNNKVGKTTMSEAQLIGRGARYCPFIINNEESAFQRKFDGKEEHELKICEELFYHCFHNPRYIQEIKQALRETGILDNEMIQREVKLKDSFKATKLYKAGLIFKNERLINDRTDVFGVNTSHTHYYASFQTGYVQETKAFDENAQLSGGIKTTSKTLAFKELGKNTLKRALNKRENYNFDSLKKNFPNLKSKTEFLSSDDYFGKFTIEVTAPHDKINNLTAQDKLSLALKVLDDALPTIEVKEQEYKGSFEFKPFQIKEVFTDKKLNFAAKSSDAETGKSMSNRHDTNIFLDLMKEDWFAYDDCFGTSEEKFFIKFIEAKIADMKEKYNEIYLLRNERFFKLYNFDDGQPTEPDFVLFLKSKKQAKDVQYQIFIEPKGSHLLLNDKWKQQFLTSLKDKAKIIFKDADFVLWGLPFYNNSTKINFEKAFKELV